VATATTPADAGRRPAARLWRRAWPVGLAGVVLVSELCVGAALVEPRLARLLVLAAAVLGLAFVFSFPLASFVGLLFLAASIFHGSYFTWSLGPVDVHPEEAILLALWVVAVVAPRRQTWGGAAGAALAVFLGSVIVAAWLGVQAGRVTPSDAVSWARPLIFYSSFWLVLRLFPDPGQLRTLLLAGLTCGAATGVLALVLQFASSLVDTFQGTGGQQIYTQTAEAGLGALKRIREPGLAFSYILFWWSVVAVIAARPGRRALLATLAAASALDVLLSFNRNMWLGLMFGTAIMLGLSGVQVRQRLFGSLAVGAAAVVLMFSVVGDSGGSQGIEPIVQRAASVLTPQQLGEESSLRDRAEETAQAWRTVQAHPVFGVGAGADFGVRFNHQEASGTWVNTVQRFLHDQWLWLLLIGGAPALLAYLAFIATMLARAWSPATRTPSLIALGAGVAMVMVSAFVMPYLGVKEFCLALGVVTAAVTRMHELERSRRSARA
jgi:O-antigen ligase